MARPRAKCRLPTTERNRHEDQMRVSYQVPRTCLRAGVSAFVVLYVYGVSSIGIGYSFSRQSTLIVVPIPGFVQSSSSCLRNPLCDLGTLEYPDVPGWWYPTFAAAGFSKNPNSGEDGSAKNQTHC